MTGSLAESSSPDSGREVGPSSTSLRVKRIAGYLYAIVLPWLAAYFSFREPALRGMRLALSFSAIAGAATLFDPLTAVVTLAVSVVSFEYYLPTASSPESGVDRVIRVAVLFLAGGLVALIIRQRHTAERQQRIALATLREQADALIQAQQASRSAAWTFNTRTGQTRWYEGGADIFGRPHEEIIALGNPSSLIFEEDRARIAAAAKDAVRAGKPSPVEYRVLWPNGEIHWLEARGAPLGSDPTLWRGATIDVTERKQAEAALIRSEKLAVAGRLAASIAHEINNPLEAVTNLCYLAKHTAVDEETRTYIGMAEDELSRVAHITSQTLRFHRQQMAAVATNLEETLRSIVTLYESRLAQAGVVVKMECMAAPALVCYAGEIRQVLANLVANAIDAMPKGGMLRLRVRPSIDWRNGSSAVRVTVADTGYGMSAETRKRIYEPFYTTKDDVGTGLGLWVTAGIVEKHNGSLRVRSSMRPEMSGSVFALLLPYQADGADRTNAGEAGVSVGAKPN